MQVQVHTAGEAYKATFRPTPGLKKKDQEPLIALISHLGWGGGGGLLSAAEVPHRGGIIEALTIQRGTRNALRCVKIQ